MLTLDERMKSYYENATRNYLPRRMPVIIRIDGKAFHTFTKELDKPFDKHIIYAMKETAKYLCKNVQGCKLAYTQSDEISLLLTDYDTLETDAWFGYNIQKMVSVSASMATLAFNHAFVESVISEYVYNKKEIPDCYSNKFETALFDSRVFVLPKEEVCNYFIWRQQDGIRNSKQALGQKYLSYNELYGLKTDEIVKKLEEEHCINWNGLPSQLQRGIYITKEQEPISSRTIWMDHDETPLFKVEREAIEEFI